MKANLKQRESRSSSPLDHWFAASHDTSDDLYRIASCHGIDPVRYVELFWEEA